MQLLSSIIWYLHRVFKRAQMINNTEAYYAGTLGAKTNQTNSASINEAVDRAPFCCPAILAAYMESCFH